MFGIGFRSSISYIHASLPSAQYHDAPPGQLIPRFVFMGVEGLRDVPYTREFWNCGDDMQACANSNIMCTDCPRNWVSVGY